MREIRGLPVRPESAKTNYTKERGTLKGLVFRVWKDKVPQIPNQCGYFNSEW